MPASEAGRCAGIVRRHQRHRSTTSHRTTSTSQRAHPTCRPSYQPYVVPSCVAHTVPASASPPAPVRSRLFLPNARPCSPLLPGSGTRAAPFPPREPCTVAPHKPPNARPGAPPYLFDNDTHTTHALSKAVGRSPAAGQLIFADPGSVPSQVFCTLSAYIQPAPLLQFSKLTTPACQWLATTNAANRCLPPYWRPPPSHTPKHPALHQSGVLSCPPRSLRLPLLGGNTLPLRHQTKTSET